VRFEIVLSLCGVQEESVAHAYKWFCIFIRRFFIRCFLRLASPDLLQIVVETGKTYLCVFTASSRKIRKTLLERIFVLKVEFDEMLGNRRLVTIF
jgi:hypothetical protein